MKKIIYGILATVSGLVLLFSYRTSVGESLPTVVSTSPASTDSQSGASASQGSSTSTDGDGSTSGDSESSSSTSNGSDSGSGSASSSTLTDGTYTGQSASTRFGPVQVQITVTGGQITAVTVPEYPNSNHRDVEINERALPQLVSETLDAQSASIDMVSGATYTSDGYARSLQSALDEAAA